MRGASAPSPAASWFLRIVLFLALAVVVAVALVIFRVL
jgi:hypothetical protein